MITVPELAAEALGSFLADRMTRKAENARRKAVRPMTPPAIPVTYVMVNLCVAASLLSQLPLFALIIQCTDWLRL